MSVAGLAWQVYTDLKARGAKPSKESLARQVRVMLGDGEHVPGPHDEQVIEVVVEEMLQDDDVDGDHTD